LKKHLVIAIYNHPEAYPPTLNAINELAKVYDEIHVLYRPNLNDYWPYPKNVRIYASGKKMTVKDQAELPTFSKIVLFIQFLLMFFKLVIKHKPKLILVYDTFPLLSYYLFKKLLLCKHELWYHNHDVTDHKLVSKYSIAWFAAKIEENAFDYINIFSLPSIERLKYFKMGNYKGEFFFIPNYPAKKVYDPYYIEKKITNEAVLIFQGRISESHGLEIITSLLNYKVNGINLTLSLKGISSKEFQQEIFNIADNSGTREKIKFLGMTSYSDVPIEGNKAHIGIGIFTKNDVMNNTIGTASNKLYEYIAMGLPVLYYDNDYFNKHLNNYKWAVKCKLNKESILTAIEYIVNNYTEMSNHAREDFKSTLNFETCFEPIINYINKKIV
jgi:hypothetical protein